MSGSVLEIGRLEVMFPGLMSKTSILRGINLHIGAGQIHGLVGESGSGKSMTALACLGMVPPHGIVSGSIQIDDREIVGRPEVELRAIRGGRVAMIFQNPARSMNPFFTLGQQMVEIIRSHRPMSRQDARLAAIIELKSVRIPDPELALDKYPHQLSGGQIQRAMIALALACRPRLLIADEPTTALDVTVQAQIVALLRRLADDKGLAVLFITHDLGVVSQLCDRVAVMYAGRIVESGRVEDVIGGARHPYTMKLLSAVPSIGRHRELASIPGQVPNPAFVPAGCAFHDRCDRATSLCAETAPPTSVLGLNHEAECHHAGSGEQVLVEMP